MKIDSKIKQRYLDFWERKPTDRACLYITSWDGTPFPAPVSLEQKWEDTDYREKFAAHCSQHTKYYAEAFPTIFTNFGPGSLAACIGGGYRLEEHTVWFESNPPFITDWDNRPSLTLDRNSKMYRMTEELIGKMLTHKDEFFTSLCDIGGTFDIIAALRGTENLLYDMYDYPDEVKAFRDELAPIWKQYFLEQAAKTMNAQGGVTSWMSIWSDKTYYPLQCDYSAMLSPAMFKEFILPDLKEQTEYMDRSIYHLDGMGEIPHLDMLLSLPRLNAIQWTSGAGKPPVTDPCWFDMYRKIQDAGKGIVLLDVAPEGLEELFKNVSQKGMYVSTYVSDEKQANELIEMATKLNF